MPVARTPEGRWVYVLETEIDCMEFDPKYPKNPKNFGQRLRKKRMDMGLTMREIAERLEVSETTVYNWEVRNIRPYRKTEEKLKAILDLKEEISVQRAVLNRL